MLLSSPQLPSTPFPVSPHETTITKSKSIPKYLNLLQIAQLCQEHIDVKDRKYHFKTFPQCFIASDAVTFLVNQGLAQTRKDAVLLGRRLEKEVRLWHHVCNDHSFKDEHLFFRFYSDDDDNNNDDKKKMTDVFFGKTTTTSSTATSSTIIRQGEESLLRIADALELGLDIGNRIHRFKMYHNCFTASEAIDYMVQHDLVSTRQEAVQIGQRLEMEMGFWYCVQERQGQRSQSQPQGGRNNTTSNRGSVVCGGSSGVKNNNSNNNNGGAQFRDECIIFRLKHAQVDDNDDDDDNNNNQEKDVDDDSGAVGRMAPTSTSLSASAIAAAAAARNYQNFLCSLKSSLISRSNANNNKNNNNKSIMAATVTTTTTATTYSTHRSDAGNVRRVVGGGTTASRGLKNKSRPTNNKMIVVDDSFLSSEEFQPEMKSIEFNQISNNEKAKMVLKEFGLGMSSSTDLFRLDDDEDEDDNDKWENVF